MVPETKCLEIKDYPRWYNVRFARGETPALHVMIHKECIPHLKVWKPTDKIVAESLAKRDLTDNLFGKFDWDWQSPAFGIGNSIVRVSGVGDYATYRVEFPVGRVTLPEVCETCDGTRKDPLTENECIRCEGTGKKVAIDWKAVYRSLLSLAFLFMPLDQPPAVDTSSQEKQLSIIQVSAFDFEALCGTFSPLLCKLLCENSWSSVEEKIIRSAILSTHKYVCGENSLDEHFTKVEIERGRISLHSSTVGCMIYAPDCVQGYRDGIGCRIHDSDIVSPMYIFPLLAGLASFLEIADVRLGKEMPHSLVS